jgi:DNA-binding beta-propeller fold protein YncE
VAADDPANTNVPTLTQNCTRPMLYASYRYQLTGVNFTAEGIDPATLPPGAQTRDSCCGLPDGSTPVPAVPAELDPCTAPEVYVGAFCASPDQVGEACAVICEPQVRAAIRFNVAGVDPLSPTSAAALGDIAFGDRCGNDLYMIQTNPGALLHVDTSLDTDNETFDISSGPPIEVCDQPTRLEIWRDAGFAFVACFQSAYVYVVDLQEWKVVDTVIAGTGPHDLVVDEAREVLYVANTLEGSVSVIDLGQDRPTRFKEVARIGLQEPFRR